MRNYCLVTVSLSQRDCLQCLRQCSDLIRLDKDCVCATFLDSFREIFHIGYKEVISDKLAPVPDLSGQQIPSEPIILRHSVLYRVYRIPVDQGFKIVHLLSHGQPPALRPLEDSIIIAFLLIKLRRSTVQGNCHIDSRNVTCSVNCNHYKAQDFFDVIE